MEKYILNILWIIMTIYIVNLTPDLPDQFVTFFNTWYIIMIIIATITYVTYYDVITGCLLLITYFMLLSMLNEKEIADTFIDNLKF